MRDFENGKLKGVIVFTKLQSTPGEESPSDRGKQHLFSAAGDTRAAQTVALREVQL